MAPPKIDPDALQTLLDAGRSQAEAARHFGVSEAAISQRVRKLTGLTSRVVALEKAGEVVDRRLDASDRLEAVQQVIDEELRWAVAQAKRGGADRTSPAGHDPQARRRGASAAGPPAEHHPHVG